jgi:hypothetical protein
MRNLKIGGTPIFRSSKLKAQSSKLKAQSSKLKAQSSKLKAQSSKRVARCELLVEIETILKSAIPNPKSQIGGGPDCVGFKT